MSTEPRHVAIARLSGDIATKARQTRRRFQRKLKSNLKDALNRAKVDYSFEFNQSRIDIDTADPAICEQASRVFGIHSVTPGRAYDWESIDDIVRIGTEEFCESVAQRKFAVRARRTGAGKEAPFKSPDIERALGARLVECGGSVDLDDPDFVARVDVRRDDAVFYEESIPGPNGLPAGVEGRALALISGGFDSSVAAWSMLGRGVELDFVFFNLGGPPHEQGVVDVLRTFVDRWCYGWRPVLHRVDFRPVVGEMKAKTDGRYWQVLLKRLMLRAAAEIARRNGHLSLITGDALGQVSSQTLHNLAAVTAPIDRLVLRPLIAWNKDDIVNLSRIVGTHDLSATTPEYCALDASKPATKCSIGELDDVEANLDLAILDELVDHVRSDRADKVEDPTDVDVRISAVPDGAVVLDLRDDREHEAWAPEGAVHFPYGRALESFALLPREEATYVLVCEVGLKSAFLAEQMRVRGWNASSFAGGVPALKRWLKRSATT